MNKPLPKELVIQKVALTLLKIFVTSEDARNWIVSKAPIYGSLIVPVYEPNSFFLSVTPTFDVDEVITYLKSYND